MLQKIITVFSILLLSFSVFPQSDSLESSQIVQIKPYRDVITDKAITTHGMLSVHEVETKFYFELSNNILGRDIMVINRLSKGSSDLRAGIIGYSGDQINGIIIRFEKGRNNKVFLRKVSFNELSTDSSQPMYQAVINSNIQPIAAAFDIKTINPITKALIIEVTDYLKGDNDVLFFDPNIKSQFKLGALQADKSYVSAINTYPVNTEIKTIKTYTRIPQQSLFGGTTGTGTATIEINSSLVLLPARPMMARYYDQRIGYFTTSYIDFDKDPQGVKRVDMIKRWRLEPKDEDIEKYKRGELVEPKKSIVFYIDPATPQKWIPYLKMGVNDWQHAFEEAGFKNAIYAREAPTRAEDSTWSIEDARFSAIVYKPSMIANASGPSIADPRSGEILESHVNWYHNVMKLLRNWYFIQTAAVDTQARKMEFSDSLMGKLIRFVSSHEIGHALGLRHNFGASSTVPVDSLRSNTFLEKHGHTPSIMDYARFNYVAQPEDMISQAYLFPRIGEYDKWAIEWGYRLFPGINDSKREVPVLNKLTLSKSDHSVYWFGTEGDPDDPRSQSEDLGDNAMKAGDYGIKNLKRVIANLLTWTGVANEGYDNLKEMYDEIISQYMRYIGHVIKNIGGIYETPKTIEQTGNVYEFVPREKQIEAMDFLNRNVFTTPAWLANRNISNKIGGDPVASTKKIHEKILSELLDVNRLNKLISAEAQTGSKAYKVEELFIYLQKEIWNELFAQKPVDVYRRNLQKVYLEHLIAFIVPKTDRGSTNQSAGLSANVRPVSVGSGLGTNDIISIAKAQAKKLKRIISTAIVSCSDSITKYHLQDCLERINESLNINQP